MPEAMNGQQVRTSPEEQGNAPARSERFTFEWVDEVPPPLRWHQNMHTNPEVRDARKEALERLREQPGRWALVEIPVPYGVARERASTIRRCEGGVFDAACRTINGEYHIYARYLGDGDLPEEDDE